MKHIKIITSFCLFGVFLMQTGCSAIMAASGEQDPDLSIVRVGATRAEVELQLGEPYKVQRLGEREVAYYEFEVGDEPSAGRSMGHAVMFVATLGVWELIFTPVEATRGDDHKVVISYDGQDRVTAIQDPERLALKKKRKKK